MIIILAVIATYVGSILFLRWRCANTLSLRRQLTDFSTFMVPFNLPAYLLSKVPTTSRVDPALFPGLKVLEENWETIRDEALALYQHGHIAAKDDLPASSFYKDNRWKSFYLKLYDNNIPSARELAPRTLALIEQVPGMNMALFAVLMPGKKLNKHHDPFAYTLRYSLGLSTPNDEGCGLFVDDADYTWRDGDAILFDETYLHHAYNNTETPRIILMTDVDSRSGAAWCNAFISASGASSIACLPWIISIRRTTVSATSSDNMCSPTRTPSSASRNATGRYMSPASGR